MDLHCKAAFCSRARAHSTSVRTFASHGICDGIVHQRLLAFRPGNNKMPRHHTFERSLPPTLSASALQGKAHRCCDWQQRRSCRRRDCMGRGDWWANPDRNLDDGSICDQPPSRASRIAPCCGTTSLTRPHSTTVRHGICDHKIQERLLALGPRIKQMPRPHSSEASSVAARQGKAHRCCDRQQRRSCRRRDCMGRSVRWANASRD